MEKRIGTRKTLRSRSRSRSPVSKPVANRSRSPPSPRHPLPSRPKPMWTTQKKKVKPERLQIVLDNQEEESETLYGKHLFYKKVVWPKYGKDGEQGESEYIDDCMESLRHLQGEIVEKLDGGGFSNVKESQKWLT